jgi:hypothetical protein
VIAAIVLSCEPLMGIRHTITMPLFIGSNALLPVDLMPSWLRVLSHVNPLSCEVDGSRGLLSGTLADVGLYFGGPPGRQTSRSVSPLRCSAGWAGESNITGNTGLTRTCLP